MNGTPLCMLFMYVMYGNKKGVMLPKIVGDISLNKGK